MKMCKYLLLLLVISGCAYPATTNIIKERPIVFIPDNRFFVCPSVQDFPNPTTLTDKQVAKLLVQLSAYNAICRDSIRSIQSQLIAAKKTLEGKIK